VWSTVVNVKADGVSSVLCWAFDAIDNEHINCTTSRYQLEPQLLL
jgi:hypothetical protein